MSMESSNLVQRLNKPEHDEVRRLIAQDAESRGGKSSTFTLDGERGVPSSKLCRVLPNGQEQRAKISLELPSQRVNYSRLCSLWASFAFYPTIRARRSFDVNVFHTKPRQTV